MPTLRLQSISILLKNSARAQHVPHRHRDPGPAWDSGQSARPAWDSGHPAGPAEGALSSPLGLGCPQVQGLSSGKGQFLLEHLKITGALWSIDIPSLGRFGLFQCDSPCGEWDQAWGAGWGAQEQSRHPHLRQLGLDRPRDSWAAPGQASAHVAQGRSAEWDQGVMGQRRTPG